MVPFTLPDAPARCGKDCFPEGSRLRAGTLRGRDGPAQRSLCKTSLQGPCVVPLDAAGQMWLVNPLTEGPVRGDGAQIVGSFLLGLGHAPDLFPIPAAAPGLPAGCGERNLPSAGEGLTGLPPSRLLCDKDGRKCCRNRCSLSGLKRKPCKERKPGARSFWGCIRSSLPCKGLCPVCGVSTAPDTRCSSL